MLALSALAELWVVSMWSLPASKTVLSFVDGSSVILLCTNVGVPKCPSGCTGTAPNCACVESHERGHLVFPEVLSERCVLCTVQVTAPWCRTQRRQRARSSKFPLASKSLSRRFSAKSLRSRLVPRPTAGMSRVAGRVTATSASHNTGNLLSQGVWHVVAAACST